MGKTVRIVLAGAGGYGEGYVRAVLAGQAKGLYTLAGIVEPNPQACPILQNEAAFAPLYPNFDEFFAKNGADFAVISSPIQFHASQSLQAMEEGCHVLCEKPVCALIDDAFAMEAASRRLQKKLFIGYQWSMCRPILNLKRDILAGRYGAPKQMHSVVLWPRDETYYARAWAGRIRDKNGYILDSVAMNATAHYLHNLLFLAGGEMDASATPGFFEASCLRANDIETYDTIALRMTLSSGAMLSFTATHACEKSLNPSLFLEFENGSVRFGPAEGTGRLTGEINGDLLDYGVPGGTQADKLALCLGDGDPVSTVSAAIPHVLCLNAVSEFVPVKTVPKEGLANSGGVTFVPGLFLAAERAYLLRAMPWETSGLFDAPVGVDISDYHRFGGIRRENR